MEGQIKALRAYAEKQGYHVRRVIQEVDSGHDMDRPGFQRLMQLAQHSAFEVLVVWKRDRFARHAVGAGFYESHLRRHGVRLETVQSGPMVDSPNNRFINRIMDAAAELERDMIVERCQLGRKTMAERGFWPSRPPWGYVRAPNKALVPDPNCAALLRYAYRACIEGAVRGSLALILRCSPWQAIARLQNPLYKGEGQYTGITIAVPPIVSQEVWDQAQAAILSRSPGVRGFPTPNPTPSRTSGTASAGASRPATQ